MKDERYDVDVGDWDPADIDPRHGDDRDLDRPSRDELEDRPQRRTEPYVPVPSDRCHYCSEVHERVEDLCGPARVVYNAIHAGKEDVTDPRCKWCLREHARVPEDLCSMAKLEYDAATAVERQLRILIEEADDAR